MDYGSSSSSFGSSAGSGASLAAQKDTLMNQVRTEMAMNNAQALLTKSNEKCFEKCVTKPSSRLDNSEQTCIAKCLDRYMEAWNIVSKAYHSRVAKEAYE